MTESQSIFEAAKKVASEKGTERRDDINKKTSGFYERFKNTFNQATNLFLGAPEAVAYVGKESVNRGKEKVVEAGGRAKDKIIKAEEKVATRVEDAKNNLIDRLNASKISVRNKLTNIFNKAADIGIKNIVNPVVSGLQTFYELPAVFNDARADIEYFKADIQQTKTDIIQSALNKLQQMANERINRNNTLRDEAVNRAEKLYDKADDCRRKSQEMFNIRSSISAVEAR